MDTKLGFSLTTTLMVLVICMALTVAGLQQMRHMRQDQVRRVAEQKAEWAAESALAYALEYCGKIKQWGELGGLNGKKLTWPTRQTAHISARAMLGYVWVEVEGRSGQRRHQLKAFVGQKPLASSRHRLVIAEGQQPFFSSGETLIEGDLVLPGGKVERKALHGVPASRGQVVSGEIKAYQPSDRPQIQPFASVGVARDIAKARTMIIGRDKPPEGDVWDLQNRANYISGDFQIPPHIREIRGPGSLFVQGALTVQHPVRVLGNARLVSGAGMDIQAAVEAGASFWAGGKIHVSGALTGVAWMVSHQAVHLGPQTRLDPPSWVWVSPFKSLPLQGRPALLIEGTVRGLVSSWTESNALPLIRIRQGARVEGLVYSQGRLIVEAELRGHVWTQTFETLQGARAFQNWFRHAKIKAPAQPLLAVPFGFGEGAQVLSRMLP